MGLDKEKRSRDDQSNENPFKVEIMDFHAEPFFAKHIEELDLLMDKWPYFIEQMRIELMQRKDIESAYEYLQLLMNIVQRAVAMTKRPDNKYLPRDKPIEMKWRFHKRIIKLNETLAGQYKKLKKARKQYEFKTLFTIFKRSEKSLGVLRNNLVVLLEEGLGGFDTQYKDVEEEAKEPEVVETIEPEPVAIQGGQVFEVREGEAIEPTPSRADPIIEQTVVHEQPYYEIIDEYDSEWDEMDMGRTSEPLNIQEYPSLTQGGKTRIAVDTARYGEDRTVIGVAQGDHMVDMRSFPKQDLMESVGRVVQAIEEYGAREARIEITGGLGAAIYDRLKEIKRENPHVKKCKLVALEIQGAPTNRGEKLKAYNLRAELYLVLEEKLRIGRASLCPDKELGEDIAHIRYKVNSLGKIQILDKEEIKKQLGRSPDKADMAAMLFWDAPVPKLYI